MCGCVCVHIYIYTHTYIYIYIYTYIHLFYFILQLTSCVLCFSHISHGRHICTIHTPAHANSRFTSNHFTLDSPKTQPVNSCHYLMPDTFLALILFQFIFISKYPPSTNSISFPSLLVHNSIYSSLPHVYVILW